MYDDHQGRREMSPGPISAQQLPIAPHQAHSLPVDTAIRRTEHDDGAAPPVVDADEAAVSRRAAVVPQQCPGAS